ncbi:MAG TPA: hypothetical protein VNT60_05660, partial [Deinococcales bacterium]|nr:hypothetical protein [Deinococcales bacterium]
MSHDGEALAAAKLTRARAWAGMRYPYLAVLALHLPQQAAPGRGRGGWTDGRTLYYDPQYVAGLDDAQARGLVLHLVLHAALGHPWRRAGREEGRWEAACDIVVNGVLRRLAGTSLPPGASRTDPKLEGGDVEGVYARLPSGLEAPESGSTQAPQAQPDYSTAQGLDDYWSGARRAAESAGDDPGGVARHYPKARPALDWRTRLTRYMTAAMLDYSWSPPDRRMMAHDVLYPSLAGETAWV